MKHIFINKCFHSLLIFLGCDIEMKILHFISGGDTGGAKTHVLTLIRRLIEIDIEVELMCIMEGVFTKEAKRRGIPVKIIPQKKRYDITVISKICRYINKGNYDLVHCHGARANYIAMFIKRKINIPIITTLHSDYKLDFKDTWYKQAVFAPVNSLALRCFKYVLTVTEAFKKMLIERGFDENRLFVVYNGIDFDYVPDMVEKEEFFSRFGIDYDDTKIYVGIAARLYAVKGISTFIEAAEMAVNKNKNIVFIIAGDGSGYEKYETMIKNKSLTDKIYMLGHVNDIDSFYNAIDINTLTSLSESFPYALLEGARMKKATISTDVGGISEMIKDGKTGYLVKTMDTKGLCEKILLLSENAQLRKKLGESFYNDTKNKFSDKKMALTHKQIYEKIIKENEK